MTPTDSHPALAKIQQILANKKPVSSITPPPKQEPDNKPIPSLSDPPLFKKAAKLLNPPLFNKLTAMTKKFTAKSIKPIKPIPSPISPTKPTKVPTKFSLNHTSASWKP